MTNVDKELEQLEFSYVVGWTEKCATIWKTVYLIKLNIHLPHNSMIYPRHSPKRNGIYMSAHKDLCVNVHGKFILNSSIFKSEIVQTVHQQMTRHTSGSCDVSLNWNTMQS